MNLVINNPYRIVGLLVGATAREQERQVKRLKQFVEAEQEPQDDFSFPTLGDLQRNLENINEASSKLNLDSDKMSSALFWFYNGSHTDEPAFDAIKEGDLDQVINIWSKLTATSEVNQRNASAYNNLSTLYLSGILEGTKSNEAILEQGISLKLKFLESDFIKSFKELATDETFKTTKKELQLLFLSQLEFEIEKNRLITTQKFLEILTKQTFSAKDDFLKEFVQKPIEQIEQKIEKAKEKRKTKKINLAKVGQELFSSTANDLTQLKNIIGSNNIKYTTLVDKLANEILQCSIDYFNESQKNEINDDYSEIAIKLAKQAKTIAFGNLTKDRIKDTIKTLEEMKDVEILQALEVLKSIKDAFETNKAKINADVRSMNLGYNQTINWSKVNDMIEKCLDWDKVVSLIQDVIPQKNIDKIKNTKNSYQIIEYQTLVDFVISKLSYSQINKVKYICYWKEVSPIWSTTKNLAAKKVNDGCYIATMAYGDYEHPQVMILRQFRDEVLDKSSLGKWFIKTYYHYSPKLVERLKNQRTVNIIIRKVLNQFIKLIK